MTSELFFVVLPISIVYRVYRVLKFDFVVFKTLHVILILWFICLVFSSSMESSALLMGIHYYEIS